MIAPVIVALVELCETVVEADCVVVPLELPVEVVLTGPTEKVELGRKVLVPLPTEAAEDERLEVDEASLVRGAVGPEDKEIPLELPYGAPIGIMLELIPLEGTGEGVETMDALLLVTAPLEDRDDEPVVRGAVGPTCGALLVLFP